MLGVAATHQAVAVVQSPDAATDTTVDEADPLGGELLRVCDVVGELGVAAVDDDVALGEEAGQLGDRLVRGSTGRNHDPHDAGGRQLGHHRLEALDVTEAGGPVVSHDGVTCAANPLAHVATHLAQADESEVHVVNLPGRQSLLAAA